ncbi:unnamed protein product [Linum trigynum]|uniref:Uncharacterized protein n=1 Tax=Linum trigynum TaxID=586398 RepID=A0AAV2EQR7_9ROSI
MAQTRLSALVALVEGERQERSEESRRVWCRLDDLHAMMVAMQGGRRPLSAGRDEVPTASGGAAVRRRGGQGERSVGGGKR